MLTQLSTVKSRLAIPEADTTSDALLASAIKAISARFDKETIRTLARTASATFEFPADDTEISPPCYPIESVTKFETKTTEAEGWQEKTATAYLIRSGCVISLNSPFSFLLSPATSLVRVTYTGGYLLPGSPPPDPPVAACQGLPDDLEQACVEQVAFWFQNKDRLGLKTYWPSGDAYRQFAALDLLDSVKATLSHYRRWYL
jgi:hypothetical protein